jgi:hypothetical protein
MAGGGKIKIKGGIASKNEAVVENGALLVTGLNGIGGINYTLTEQDTGLTWIDGKPIFQKTVDLGQFPNAVVKSVAHGITTIETLVDMKTIATTAGDFDTPVHFVQTGGLDGISISRNGANIDIQPGTVDRNSLSGFSTLLYTKV